MKVKIFNSGKSISVDVKRVGFLSKGIGLMFKSSNTKNLLFEFKRDVDLNLTGLFVFFPFLAIWLDEKNNVLDFEVVKPFRLSVNSGRKFRKVVEITFNERNNEIIDFFVGKRGKV